MLRLMPCLGMLVMKRVRVAWGVMPCRLVIAPDCIGKRCTPLAGSATDSRWATTVRCAARMQQSHSVRVISCLRTKRAHSGPSGDAKRDYPVAGLRVRCSAAFTGGPLADRSLVPIRST